MCMFQNLSTATILFITVLATMGCSSSQGAPVPTPTPISGGGFYSSVEKDFERKSNSLDTERMELREEGASNSRQNT